MALGWLIQSVLTLGLGALGALCGAILLWKWYALPKISKWIIEQGSGRLKAWLAAVVEDPQGEEAQQIGKLTGVAFSYALHGLEELATTEEGRERIKPVMLMLQEHIQQSIFATWGHLLKNLEKAGSAIPGAEGFGIPTELLGLGEKLIPKGIKELGIGIPQILNIAGFLNKFNTGNGGSTGSSPTGGHGPYNRTGEV